MAGPVIDLLSLPMGADPTRDQRVGMDDSGQPVYQSPFGERYVITYQMQTQEGLPQRAGNAFNALRQDPIGATGNALAGMAQGIWNGIQAPANALATGRLPTNGDLLNTVGLMAGAGGAMAAPEGALRSGAMRTAAEGLTPAQMAAQDVLERLRSGQASTVTDEMMAAADQGYLSSIYDLPLDETSRFGRAQGMFADAAKAARVDKKTPGLRTVDDPDYMTAPSRSWSASGPNGRMLGGTSATSIKDAERAFALHRLDGGIGHKVGGYYTGDTVGVIGGDRVRSGQDLGEVILREPKEYMTRSTSARFDPRLSHLKNLSAGLAALGLTNLASMFDPGNKGGM